MTNNLIITDVNEFTKVALEFMKYHKLCGMEMLIPYKDEPCFRACGNGMVHPEGTPLEGVELWESLNDILKRDDKRQLVLL